MSYPKYIFTIIFVIFLTSGVSPAQVRIVSNDNKQNFGFVVDENDSLIKLISIQNEKLEIQKSEIKSIEKLEVNFVLRNGLNISGNITEKSDSSFTVINSDSIKINILFANIDFINSDERLVKTYIQKLIIPKNNVLLSRNDEKKLRYTKIGLSVGTPGGINVNFGLNNQKIAFNLGLGISGGQIGAGLNLVSKSYFEMNFMVVAGITNRKIYGFNGSYQNLMNLSIAPLLDLNFYGINFQLGLGFGVTENSKDIKFLQIGYNYRYSK